MTKAGTKAGPSRFVALLYSISLADGQRLMMAELRDLAEKLGFAQPRTCLATGNLIFEASSVSAADIEALIEPAYAKTFGRRVDIIVRSAAVWRATMKANPFPKESKADPSHVLVRINRKPVTEDVVETLTPYTVKGERMIVAGGDLWTYFGQGIGRSKLASAMTPKRLGIGTARNWNTVQQIAALLEG